TAGYCTEMHKGANFTVKLRDGTLLAVDRIVLSQNHLLAFLKVQTVPVELKLRSSVLQPGDTVSQVKYDLQTSLLFATVGHVVKSGPLSFGAFGTHGSPELQAQALIVAGLGTFETQAGAAGSPLLDAEGNVACMTYQTVASTLPEEQCLASPVIAEAMKI